MTASLVIKEGPKAGGKLDIEGEVVIGRESESLELDDEQLSRRHAVLRTADGGLEIEDLGSLNGTFVNGQRIEGTTRLSDGDLIKVGQSVLAIQGGAGAPATVAAPIPTEAPAPEPAAAPAAAPAPAPAASGPEPLQAPSEPFGAYAVPLTKRRRGIASRQLAAAVLSWGAVTATAVALVIYFSDH
jgi:predicted component of type VI protein secretion system